VRKIPSYHYRVYQLARLYPTKKDKQEADVHRMSRLCAKVRVRVYYGRVPGTPKTEEAREYNTLEKEEEVCHF
jgi:hypothetical protein